MALPTDIDDLPSDQLRSLVIAMLTEVSALRQQVAEQREEIARLKELKGRPKIPPSKPSGMAQATPDKPGAPGPVRRRGPSVPRVAVQDEIIRGIVPLGSVFKGYQDFVVQDLVLEAKATRYRRERWVTPDGRTILAPLPGGTRGHFGPSLHGFVLSQYHQGQVTTERIVRQLRDVGIAISKRQVIRLLNQHQAAFVAENAAVLQAGVANARWLAVDDTGARHAGVNGYCTQIGNQHFTWFATRPTKSRQNFLDLLRAGQGDYVINEAALAYLRDHGLSKVAIARLADAQDKIFPDHATWLAHLDRLGISAMRGTQNPATTATEAAIWGSLQARGLLTDTVILSDDAGQFDVGLHALCWVHMERLVHKLDTFSDAHRAAQAVVKAAIWELYRGLKAYCAAPSAMGRDALSREFDRIFTQQTGFPKLDQLLVRLLANKAELLVALDRPDVPLHTNSAERDIRCQVTKRKISGGTKSAAGRNARDAFLGLIHTCGKLGVSFRDYVTDRLGGTPHAVIPPLAALIRDRASLA